MKVRTVLAAFALTTAASVPAFANCATLGAAYDRHMSRMTFYGFQAGFAALVPVPGMRVVAGAMLALSAYRWAHAQAVRVQMSNMAC